jgi:hypothetical protein
VSYQPHQSEDVTLKPVSRTGWPPPALAQDDDRKLFRWFASRPDARRLVREVAAALSQSRSPE